MADICPRTQIGGRIAGNSVKYASSRPIGFVFAEPEP